MTLPKRIYHSVSSVQTGMRCRRRWALQYLDGWRDTDVDWHDVTPETPSRVRSLSLGKAVHAQAEAYVQTRPLPYSVTSLPAQIHASGLHLLPRIGAAIPTCEGSIGQEPMPEGAPDYAPQTILVVHGVPFAGFVDLWLEDIDPAEQARLGIELPYLLVDYKTTASIARYAHRPEQAAQDLQRNLYALDRSIRTGYSAIPTRWVYLESKKIRRAWPSDCTIEASAAFSLLEEPAAIARELDQIERSQDAPYNLDACQDYGGCPLHITAGGPCTAQRSIGAMIKAQNQKRKRPTMSINAKAFENAATKFQPKARTAEEETPPADAAALPDLEVPVVKAPVKKAATKKAPAKKAPAEAPAALDDVLASGAERIREARARFDAEVDAIRKELAEALS